MLYWPYTFQDAHSKTSERGFEYTKYLSCEMRSIFSVFRKLKHAKSLDTVVNFGYMCMCVFICMCEYVILKVLILSNVPE